MNWQYYPKSNHLPAHLSDLIDVFVHHEVDIRSPECELASDQVLSILRKSFAALGFKVEKGKKAVDNITVPILIGRNGRLEKSFETDAVHFENNTVLEVEAGGV